MYDDTQIQVLGYDFDHAADSKKVPGAFCVPLVFSAEPSREWRKCYMASHARRWPGQPAVVTEMGDRIVLHFYHDMDLDKRLDELNSRAQVAQEKYEAVWKLVQRQEAKAQDEQEEREDALLDLKRRYQQLAPRHLH